MNRKEKIFFDKKLIIPLGAIIVVLLVILGFVAGAVRGAAIAKKDKEIQTASAREIIQFQTWNNEILSKFSTFVNNLTKNKNLSRAQVENAVYLAKQGIGKEKTIVEISVAFDDEKDLFSLFGFKTEENYLAKNQPWYTEAIDAIGEIVVTTYNDTKTSNILISYSKEIQIDGTDAVIVMDFRLNEMLNDFGDNQNKYSFLVDEKNNIIYHPNEELIYQNSMSNIGAENEKKFVNLFASIAEKDHRLIKGGTLFNPEYMMQKRVDGTKWVLVTVSDGYEVLIYNCIFAVIAVLLVISVLAVGVVLSKYMRNGKAVAMSRYIKQNGFIQSLIVVFLLTILLAVITFFYVNTINNINKEELYKNTGELAIKSAELVNKQIMSDFNIIISTATMIGRYADIDEEDTVELLKEEATLYNFKRMALIDLDGNAITSDNLTENFAQREYFIRALAGTTNISDTLVDKFDRQLINVYATPVYTNGTLTGVLIATSANEDFTNLLSVPTYQGMGYTYIVQSTGEKVVGSNHVMSTCNFDNIFDIINEKTIINESVDKMKTTMLDGDGGILQYNLFDEMKYMNYEPIGINDWYICSVMSEALLMEKSNQIISISLMGSIAIVTLFGMLMLFIVLSQSNTKRKLSTLAYVDPVTGYNNMNMFAKEASRAMEEFKGQSYAMVAMDIDKFKMINDALGRNTGDEILKYCADVVIKNLENGEYACRNVSDHFFMLVHYDSVKVVLDRIKAISNSVRNCTAGMNILLSFGIYEITQKDESIEDMCYYATIAKTTIKGNHNTFFAFYSSSVRSEMLAEKEIENVMYQALDNGEFVVFLQPKYHIKTDAIVGAEALVRWVSVENVITPPDKFIPLFERNGFIIKLDYYVWEQVIKTIAGWVEAGKTPVPISINVSRRHFVNSEFINVLLELLDRYKVDIKLIEVELTETSFISKDIVIYDIAKMLSKNGFNKSIDDFGSGYSSLNLLRKIDVEVIKIDKEFLDSAAVDLKGEIVLRNIVSLIKQLNMTVVVEGVETAEHVRFLTEIDCQIAQGYFYARPLPVVEFEELLFGSSEDTKKI